MKRITLILCTLMTSLCITAQVKHLDEIQSGKQYLLRNCNGYGYCIYNSSRADYTGTSSWHGENYLTLGQATAIHPAGLANDAFLETIDTKSANNQWYIEKQSNGMYYLKNVAQNMYATNEFSINFGAGVYYYTDECWQLAKEAVPIRITEVSDGVFAFQTVTGNTSDEKLVQRYMCAATQKANAVANWTIEDLGSQWQIIDANGTIPPLNPDEGEGDKDPNTGGGTGEGNGDYDMSEEDDSLGLIHYFTLTDGQMIAIPKKYLLSRQEEDGKIMLNLMGDTTLVFKKKALASEDTTYNGVLPVYESFKFNNKFNDQLFKDVDGIIDNENNNITLSVATIGKRLIPSFKLSEENSDATTWVNGIQQHSKQTSQRYDKPLTYTLAKPKQWIYRYIKVSDAIYENPETDTSNDEWIITPVELTADMLSTNWPSVNANEGVENLLDGITDTYFHSNWSATNNWSEGSYYGDGETTWPYLQIEPIEPLENLRFEYTTRNNASNGGYAPQGFILQASKDGSKWYDIRTFTADKDNLPTGAAVTYTSPIINMGDAYKYLRLQLTESTRKNYLVLSEFKLDKVEANPDYGKEPSDSNIIVPAVYKKGFFPYGRNYKVSVEYLTDKSTSQYRVPTIRINTLDGTWINSKTRFWDASFDLDGAGIWEDMHIDSMQIKGRGNSSWGGGYSKEPYRMKFASKIKPFGLTKGKSWVLLANKQTGSMTTNAIAMKLADMVKTDGCNHIIPVELYINNEYRGSYNFTEKVGFSNNSIDLDDESNAVMIELDSYYDEVYKFKDQYYNLPTNISQPDLGDLETITNLTFDDIKESFNNFTYQVKMGETDEIGQYLDIEAYVRAWFVNDFTRNQECKHPKSWYLYNADILNDSLWAFGPVWDFDWAYGYDGTGQYFINSAQTDIFVGSNNLVGYHFFHDLIQRSDMVKKAYYRLWTEFLHKDGLDNLLDWLEDYHAFTDESFKHNATRWSDGNAYDKHLTNAKNWLTKRANYIYSHLTKYDISDDIDEPEQDINFGQPDVDIKVEDDDPTRIDLAKMSQKPVDVYTLHGVRMRTQVPAIEATRDLMPGIYIIGGRKVIIR